MGRSPLFYSNYVRNVTSICLLQMAKLSVAGASDTATASSQPLPQPTPPPSSPTPPLPPPTPPALRTVAAPSTAANPPARQVIVAEYGL